MAEPSLAEVMQQMVQHMRERAAMPHVDHSDCIVLWLGPDDLRSIAWPAWERHSTMRPMLHIENSWDDLLEALPEPPSEGALVEHYVDCECAGAGLLGAEPVETPYRGMELLVCSGYVNADGDMIDARAFNGDFGGLHWHHGE